MPCGYGIQDILKDQYTLSFHCAQFVIHNHITFGGILPISAKHLENHLEHSIYSLGDTHPY